MKYKIFDTVSYGHMEPRVPFSCVHECETLEQTKDFCKSKMKYYIICNENNKILFDSDALLIYK
mgnify:CR=1 FL=1